MSKRRDKCKCGKLIVWDDHKSEVICRHCKTIYNVEANDILVYWLEEKIENGTPYKTDAR